MNKSIQLESLNLAELNTLLSHLRLGTGHLKKQLTSSQLSNLLSLGSIDYNQFLNISSNKFETSGNVALVLNTVITSVFGAWMGFSGFMELHLDSYIVLSLITSIAVFVSSLVGFFSFKLTNDNAKSAIHNQRIYNLQLEVLKLIINKENEPISSHVKFLNHALYYVTYKNRIEKHLAIPTKKSTFTFDNNTDYMYWLTGMQNAINYKINVIAKEKIYKFYSVRLAKTVNTLKETIELSYSVNSPPSIWGSHLNCVNSAGV